MSTVSSDTNRETATPLTDRYNNKRMVQLFHSTITVYVSVLQDVIKMILRELLFLLENWLSGCYSCVKWHSAWSEFFRLDFGVRQGSVLAPLLFALYVDDIANISKHVQGIFVFLYADDILILSPTVSKLQELLNVIECELQALDLTINSKKILLFTYRF